METFNWKRMIYQLDERRGIIIPGNAEETVKFCTQQFLQIGRDALQQHNFFAVALSGGQTPYAIFKELSQHAYRDALDWSKVLCFWSDERNVPPNHPESNYFNAMQAGLAKLLLKAENIFRMPAEKDIEESAHAYEELIREKVPSLHFDLIMLGMGEDGHTASLFPRTHGLHTKDRLVIANYISQKQTWRMSMTYECIHMANTICLYAMGTSKAKMVAKALLGSYDPDNLPVQRIGTPTHPALWILDEAASELLVDAMGVSVEDLRVSK
jgi:6-phosphogluconolactonase